MGVIVGIRVYKDNGEVDVEVFADTPNGREYSEYFLRADAGIADARLIENVKVEG